MQKRKVQRRDSRKRIHTRRSTLEEPNQQERNQLATVATLPSRTWGVEQTFRMSITGTFKNDSMLRQVTEAVQINNTDADELMNDRSEWNHPRVPRTIITTD